MNFVSKFYSNSMIHPKPNSNENVRQGELIQFAINTFRDGEEDRESWKVLNHPIKILIADLRMHLDYRICDVRIGMGIKSLARIRSQAQ